MIHKFKIDLPRRWSYSITRSVHGYARYTFECFNGFDDRIKKINRKIVTDEIPSKLQGKIEKICRKIKESL